MFQHESAIGQTPDEEDLLGALVGRAKQGSASAFRELAMRVQSRIRRWAVEVTTDQDDADDVAQLVLLKLHQRLGEFEGRSRFTTWLYRMTRNTALNRRRTDRRRAGLLRAGPPPAAIVSPDASVLSNSDRLAELIRSYSTELDGREREVFEMSDVRGLSTAEIAAALGVQPVTVRAALSRARRRIRLRMLELHRDLLEDYDP